MAGLDAQLRELEKSDEIEELKRIGRRLDQLTQHELSYAQQRADGSITELVQRELMHAESQLTLQAERIEQARQQRGLASSPIRELPEVLPNLTREEKERVIMALICRAAVCMAHHKRTGQATGKAMSSG